MTTDFTDARQWIFVNGHAVSGLLAQDRGFLYGDGLFETMRVSRGQIPLLSFHLDRLRRDCQRLTIDIQPERVLSEINQSLSELKKHAVSDARMRLTVTRGIGNSACYPLNCDECNSTIHITPLISSAPAAAVDLIAASQALPSYRSLAGVKHLNRLPYILACLNVKKDVGQEVFFCDEAGRIIETLHHNIFFIRGRSLITPKIEVCGVAGVMRQLVLNSLSGPCGFEAVEENIGLHRVAEFDACFITNAISGVVKVSAISKTVFPHPERVDPLMLQLIKFLEAR